MGLLNRVSSFLFERRATVRSDDAYLGAFLSGRAYGGAAVSPDAALSNLAVAARCVSLRSELLASVGLHLFRRTADGGRERAADNPLYDVLHSNFNDSLSAFEGRELLVRNLDLYGNAFARIERNARGQVVALYPYPVGAVSVERLASGRLRYKVTPESGGTFILLADEMLHVRGPTRDGVLGQSPIQIARGALGLALAQNETASALIGNGLRPSAALTYPERLDNVVRQRVQSIAESKYGGAANAGRLIVLDGGAKFENLAWSPEDAEFLETRKLANLDVARIFGCPPTTVGIPDHGTYSNQEQESTALVRNALGPLAARVESALSRCLLTEAGRRSLYVEHDLNMLLRGDVKTRFEAYRVGREIGALSANDVRRRENEPPIPGGDGYNQPANWAPLGASPAPQPGGPGA
jgi:HK97 family phage portal protein